MKRVTLFFVSALLATNAAFAQEDVNQAAYNIDTNNSEKLEPFKHVDLSITAGSTGVGVELAMPVAKIAEVRVGGTFMPHIEKTMHFGVEVGELTRDEYQKNYLDKITDGSNPMTYEQWKTSTSNARFDKLNGIMENFLGYKVDDQVDMVGSPTFNNFKMMVDVHPFKNKNWHVTAGFYLSGRRAAKADVAIYDMPSMMAVATYNSMYYRALAEEPLISGFNINIKELNDKFLKYGRMTMHVGDFSHDVYAKEDVYYDYTEVDPTFGDYIIDVPRDIEGKVITDVKKDADKIANKDVSLRCAKGDILYHKGDAYRMVPDDDFMVKASAYVNAFKPYLGFGYGGYVDKYHRTRLSFDCGAMFWGGVPEFITHDGVDLMNDLVNVKSSIQKYLNIAKKFPVYPVLEFRVSQRIF